MTVDEQATADPPDGMDAAYPPEPWHLRGTMHVSLWRVPADELPASLTEALPHDARPVTLGGQAFVGTAFVTYAPGSVLVYDELLAATLTWHRRRPRVTISDIWVDHPASVAGGRELWGIPKHLARFERRETGGLAGQRAEVDGVELARLTTRPVVRLPGSWPVPMPTAQRLDGREHVSRVLTHGTIALARSWWTFPDTGPLGTLAGRTPVLSTTLDDVRLVFGAAAHDR